MAKSKKELNYNKFTWQPGEVYLDYPKDKEERERLIERDKRIKEKNKEEWEALMARLSKIL